MTPGGFSATIEIMLIQAAIHNESHVSTSQLIEIVKFCSPRHLLKANFDILFTSGEDENDWDGTCYPDERKIEIIIPKKTRKNFPWVVEINHDFSDSYLRGVYVTNLTEFLIFLTGHELHHIVFEDDSEFSLFDTKWMKFTQLDEESLMDFAGLLLLGKWRRKQKNY